MTEYREGKPCATCGSTQYAWLGCEWRCAECETPEGGGHDLDITVYVLDDIGTADLYDFWRADSLDGLAAKVYDALKHGDVEVQVKEV